MLEELVRETFSSSKPDPSRRVAAMPSSGPHELERLAREPQPFLGRFRVHVEPLLHEAVLASDLRRHALGLPLDS